VTSCAWVPDSCQLFTGSKCGVITAYTNRFTSSTKSILNPLLGQLSACALGSFSPGCLVLSFLISHLARGLSCIRDFPWTTSVEEMENSTQELSKLGSAKRACLQKAAIRDRNGDSDTSLWSHRRDNQFICLQTVQYTDKCYAMYKVWQDIKALSLPSLPVKPQVTLLLYVIQQLLLCLNSAGGGSDLRLWTVNGDLVGHVHCREIICSVAFSNQPEGISINVIAGGLENGIVRLWSTWDLKPVREITFPKSNKPIIREVFKYKDLKKCLIEVIMKSQPFNTQRVIHDPAARETTLRVFMELKT
ncbi:hypothetical protein P7K49_035442, partial [Saguinus oedipus]